MRQHLAPEERNWRASLNGEAYVKLERLTSILSKDIALLEEGHPEIWAQAHKRFEDALDEWLPLNPQHDKRPTL